MNRTLLLTILLCVGFPEMLSTAEANPTNKQRTEASPKNSKVLFAHFSSIKGFKASFLEEKHLSILASSLKTEGTIEYRSPMYLVRETLKPKTKLIIRENSLSYKDSVTKKDLPLGKEHPARAFVQVFLDIIRGDDSAIGKAFHIQFKSDKAGWTMTLTPKSTKTQSLLVQSITLKGESMAFSTMEVVDRHGDRTLTRFIDIQYI